MISSVLIETIHTIGFVMLALVDVAMSRRPEALFHAVALAAACGLGLDALVALSRRFWPITYAVVALTAAGLALPYTLDRSAHFSFEGRFVQVIHYGFYLAIAAGYPLLYAVARALGTRKIDRLVLGAIAIGAALINHKILTIGYYASHAFVSWAAAILAGAALSPRTPRKWLYPVAAVSLIAFAMPTPNHIRVALFKSPAAIAPWVAATVAWKLPHGPATALPPMPARAPSPRLVENPVVILFVVDSLRLDVLERNHLPAYQRLREHGVEFTNVHSPGSQTATAMTSVFSGKYYSQLSWRRYGEGHLYHAYPNDDPAPRVPALLSQAGVRTVKLGGIGFLANRYGISPGFSDERMASDDDRLAPGSALLTQVLPLLQSPSPTFVYVHFMDTHSPYGGGAPGCQPWDCYQSSVALVDRYLGQVLDAIDQTGKPLGTASRQQLAPLADPSPRTLLLFTADHGEAFGEHDSGGHSTTIYDVLLKVPLIAYGAGLSPRVVNEPVSLIDLAPTLLDLFGQPTPPGFAGESLVEKFRGDTAPLTRPIFAEGRLRRAVIDGDLKVIVDLRRKTVEAFDLARDPSEKNNLYDREPERFAAALGKLTSFFDANTAPGGPLYRP